MTREKRVGEPGLRPLSVFLDAGVVPRDSRGDNHNQLGEDLTKYLVVEPGDVVFNKLRTWQGGIGSSSYRGIVSPAYYVCRPSSDYNSRYLHHLLRSTPYLAELTRISKYMPPSQFDTPWEMLRLLPILTPSREEQRRIADFLDAETSRIDRLALFTRKQISVISERASSAFQCSVVENGGPDLAELDIECDGNRWRVLPLNRILRQLTNGYVGPTRDLFVEEGGVKYLQSLHVKSGRIDFDRRPYFVPESWAAERPRIMLSVGDLLIVQTGAIGEVAIVDEEHAGSSCHALLIARADRSLLFPDYLWHVFRSSWGKNVLLREQTGALHPHLEAGNVRFISIPVPSLEIQRRVVSETEWVIYRDEKLRTALERRLELLANRRQSLITAAVTGQFDVTTASGRNLTQGV
ncbi:hypothetical protein [Nocardia sp. NPDC004860]|uniref:hypothetical protein n=1 Tax=Nocardia sp. NPDC004860 TaxID=3154557 RepID=UPI0033AA5583